MSWLQKRCQEEELGDWVDNPNAMLPETGYWPVSNVFIPNTDVNPIYDQRVDEWTEESKEAVTGRSTTSDPSISNEFWRKLSDEPVNTDYSMLMVDDGVHRCLAALQQGEQWIFATAQAQPGSYFHGGRNMSE